MSRVVECKRHVDATRFFVDTPRISASVNYVLVEYPGETLDGFFRNYCFNCWDRNVKHNLFLWLKFPLIILSLVFYSMTGRPCFEYAWNSRTWGVIKNVDGKWIIKIRGPQHCGRCVGRCNAIDKLTFTERLCLTIAQKIYAHRLRYLRAPLFMFTITLTHITKPCPWPRNTTSKYDSTKPQTGYLYISLKHCSVSTNNLTIKTVNEYLNPRLHCY